MRRVTLSPARSLARTDKTTSQFLYLDSKDPCSDDHPSPEFLRGSRYGQRTPPCEAQDRGSGSADLQTPYTETPFHRSTYQKDSCPHSPLGGGPSELPAYPAGSCTDTLFLQGPGPRGTLT